MPSDPQQWTPRQNVLTQADLEELKNLMQCTKCSFNHDEADTLKNLAKNINTATKLSTKVIITGIVLGTLSMIWFAVKHVIFDLLATGKVPR